jgi:hypothetical protein
VKRLLVILCVMLLIIGSSSVALSAILTFDDIPGQTQASPDGRHLTNGYGGLMWSESLWDIYAIDAAELSGLVSGHYVVRPDYGDVGWVTSDRPFDFISAYITGYVSPLFAATGWCDGDQLYHEFFTIDDWTTTGASGYEPKKYVLNFYGIDTLYLRSWVDQGGTNLYNPFYIDNFEYNAPVPIPSAVWLLGSGLISIVGIRRKFKK